MVAIPAARKLVAPPARIPLSYGLLSAAKPVEDADVHWRLGVRSEPEPCGPAGVYIDSCPVTGGGVVKAATDLGEECRASTPFTVYSLPVCAPVGEYAMAERTATGALTNGEARAVEREFESGEFGTTPHLAENTQVIGEDGCIEQTAASTPVTGVGAVDLVHAIAHLESSLAECYGNEGVIHVPPAAIARGAWFNLFTQDGPRLRSPMGHLVAAGSGYRGLAPDGSAAPHDQPWLYATGAVFVYRSGITVTSTPAQALDRAKNDMYLVAERTYVLGWECCHFAIQADLTFLT